MMLVVGHGKSLLVDSSSSHIIFIFTLHNKICFIHSLNFLFVAHRFIQGATSPKDVVIILDASGSMRGVPMRIAKYSAKALIDTFEDNDYFNIVWVRRYGIYHFAIHRPDWKNVNQY